MPLVGFEPALDRSASPHSYDELRYWTQFVKRNLLMRTATFHRLIVTRIIAG
jgi:hypothetical protein